MLPHDSSQLEDPDQDRQLGADEQEEEDIQDEQEEQQQEDEFPPIDEDLDEEPEADDAQGDVKPSQPGKKPKSVQQQMDKSGRDIRSRQERRREERDSSGSSNQRQRRPQTSSNLSPTEKYSEVDNPSDQFLPPGQEPSRLDTLTGTGVLSPYTRKQVLKEYNRMQAVRNAFVAWQSQQRYYVIYQDAGYDENEGKQKWRPIKYELYPLTTSQHFRIRDMQAELDDLRRDITNNVQEIRHPNKLARKAELDLVKLKLQTYFRMVIIPPDPRTHERDPDDEFEGSSWADVRDMLEAADWAFSWVPPSRRIKSSESSGSEKEEDQSYGIR